MKIDFYAINADSKQETLRFACKLVNKAYSQNMPVYVYCDDEATASTFDQILWTFHDISFIPHEIIHDQAKSPILIGYGQQKPIQRHVLINLSKQVPDFFESFERIIELAPTEINWKKTARAHYKTYQDKNLNPNTIDLRKN